MRLKMDSYVKHTTQPDAQGFVQDIRARVLFPDRGDGIVIVRPYAVYAYHPDHPTAGRWLPPVACLALDAASLVEIDSNSCD